MIVKFDISVRSTLHVGRTMHVKVDGGINALSTSKDSSQVVVAGRSGEYDGWGQGE